VEASVEDRKVMVPSSRIEACVSPAASPDGAMNIMDRVKREGRPIHQTYLLSVWRWGRLKLLQYWTPPHEVCLIYPDGKRVQVH